MSSAIRYFHRGQLHEIKDVGTTRTVLQHLREDRHCTGTKEGCAEGDCGACTVVVGELKGDDVELKTVNACIQFLPALDGKALFTVEDLKQPGPAQPAPTPPDLHHTDRLHPVQQAMVECHGSQCGFCTPGFVMSLWSLYLKHEQDGRAPERGEIDDALSGNLCRCTGYRPIIDAARRMQELPKVAFDRTALKQALQAIQREECFSYTHAGRSFHAPRTLEQLVALRTQHPHATLLSGATDVGLWVTKQLRDLGDIIHVNRVRELARIVERDGMLEIGAAVSLDDAYRAACRHYPQALQQLWQRFASLPIRNAGTLGGNIANGSPIGDSAPWMIALGSEVVLHGATGRRVLPLDAFYLDYQKKDLRPDELVEAVRIPLPREGLAFRTYKLAKRFDQDISAVCAAFALTLDGGTIREARIAFGGMAATSRRAPQAEAALQGRTWDEAAAQDAAAKLAQDYAPLTDMRASSAYRMKAAQNLLRRFWLETRPADPLPAGAVHVFAA
ncbi:MAG TPA: xanthine dehydrogenase small subunit [Noviherbaspirillum sp.]|jgi:xanthine dehydrogenase small subunit|uniref:xanthine dehydrogenase small subunit n=1 Tax=Noviherbaspirillum sp. TaxID=1926288 RepID=UPI002F93B8E5